MTDIERAAQAVLDRFAPQLRWTVNSVMDRFSLPGTFYDDLRQDAEILLITYAGLMHKDSWGVGRLAKFEARFQGDEKQIKHYVGRQLRIDLSQIVARQLARNANEAQLVSMDELTDSEDEPTDTYWEERQITDVSKTEETLLYRAFYPTLVMHDIDGMSEVDIAKELGITDRTVRNRLMKEKKLFLTDFVTSRGLRLEGDETPEMLLEARGYLKKAGR